MTPQVEKELNTLKKMVNNWYAFYLGEADGRDNYSILVDEFEEIISLHMQPYLTRLYVCKYLTADELGEFRLFLATKAWDLAVEINEIEVEEKEDPVITLIKNLELTEKQKKAVVEFCRTK